MSSTVSQRQAKGKDKEVDGRDGHHDPLSVLDEDASAEPLDDQGEW